MSLAFSCLLDVIRSVSLIIDHDVVTNPTGEPEEDLLDKVMGMVLCEKAELYWWYLPTIFDRMSNANNLIQDSFLKNPSPKTFTIEATFVIYNTRQLSSFNNELNTALIDRLVIGSS